MEDLINLVVLADGRKVVLEDDQDISLSLVINDDMQDTCQFPHLSGNYGGGSLLLSPSERYVVFSYFSGESEEGFALLEIEGKHLRLLYDSDYLYGEDANYSFINQEKGLVQTFRTGGWYEEEAQTDENGDSYYQFGELNLLDLETNQLDRHTIVVYPSEDWVEEETDVGKFLFSHMEDGKSLCAEMPWGKEIFPYPLEETLVIRWEN